MYTKPRAIAGAVAVLALAVLPPSLFAVQAAAADVAIARHEASEIARLQEGLRIVAVQTDDSMGAAERRRWMGDGE